MERQSSLTQKIERVPEQHNRIASNLFTQRVNRPVEITLERFDIPIDFAKTDIYAAHVSFKARETVIGIPSPIIVKHYKKGVRRASENRDTAEEEYRTETAVLHLNLGIRTPWTGESEVRVYPISFSNGNPECEKERMIFREYIRGDNLEQLAQKQAQGRQLNWGGPYGSPDVVSQSLCPVVILHVNTPSVVRALYNQGLLKYETLERASSRDIAEQRANRLVRYVEILTDGGGKPLRKSHKEELKEAAYDLDRKLISKKELLVTVDGGLDVLPHHLMLNRILDAGGVEVGGFVRDLAVYSAPCFTVSLWDSPENMPEPVLNTYINLRGTLEDNLGIRNGISEIMKKIRKDEVEQGILLASVFGGIRKAAVMVHHRGRTEPSIGGEVQLHLANACSYLRAFTEQTPGNSSCRKYANTIGGVLKTYSLDSDVYLLKFVNGQEVLAG